MNAAEIIRDRALAVARRELVELATNCTNLWLIEAAILTIKNEQTREDGDEVNNRL